MVEITLQPSGSIAYTTMLHPNRLSCGRSLLQPCVRRQLVESVLARYKFSTTRRASAGGHENPLVSQACAYAVGPSFQRWKFGHVLHIRKRAYRAVGRANR